MRIIIILVLLCLTSKSEAQLIAKLGDGFGDLFGIPPSYMKNLVFESSDGNFITYNRPSEGKTYGECILQNYPSYTFYKNRLWQVQIGTDGENVTCMLTKLMVLYGMYESKTTTKSGSTKYKWFGTKNVSLELVDLGNISGYPLGCIIMFYDETIKREITAERGY